jgi:putative glutamine amidotransferase
MSRPIVVVPACTTLIEGYTFDAVGRKLYGCDRRGRGVPASARAVGTGMSDIGAILEVADAILLTGSRSNVAPEQYGEETPIKPDALDPCATR